MQTITLDRALIDYLTLTSFDELAFEAAGKVANMLIEKPYNGKRKEGQQQLQYLGYSVDTAMGTFYYGEGIQGGRKHYIIRVSGELCNEDVITLPIGQGVNEGWLRCRRIDLQITTEQPSGWVQWALFNRRKKNGRAVGWAQSNDKEGHELATVYIGQRTSARFARVYQKYSGCYLLRCEHEIKAEMAEAYAKAIFRGKETPATMLKVLIETTGDRELTAVYAAQLSGIGRGSVKAVYQEAKTAKWLRETVLPTFRRFINDHSQDAAERREIVEGFAQEIAKYGLWDSDYD